MKVAMLTVLRLDMLEQYKLFKEHGINIDVLTNGNEPNGMASRKYISQCNLNERIINFSDIVNVCKEYDVITAYEFYGENQKKIMENFSNFIPEVANNIPIYDEQSGCLQLAQKNVKSFIAKSTSVYNCLIQEGIEEGKIYIVNAPCDTERFIPKEKPDRLKDKLVFLFIGRMQEQKGIFEVFHAFHKAHIPNSKLVMIGPPHPTNPWDLNVLKKWIKSTGDDVEIHDYVKPEDIHSYYNWGDVFVSVPNADYKFVEQIGLTIPQSLASGLPVITNDFGGQIDYIDSSCGYLIPHKNYTMVAEAMKELVNRDKRILMGEKSRQRALKYFGLETYTKKVKEIYENCT